MLLATSLATQRFSAAAPIQRLECVMAKAGWVIDFMDLDLSGSAIPTVAIKCHRTDGLWLYARMDSFGRCSMDTFHRTTWMGRPANATGKWPISPQIDDTFLGRHRATGPRALMRHLTNYLVDNAEGLVSLFEMREAWAFVMQTPTQVSEPELSAELQRTLQ